jgi:hypothetical protein
MLLWGSTVLEILMTRLTTYLRKRLSGKIESESWVVLTTDSMLISLSKETDCSCLGLKATCTLVPPRICLRLENFFRERLLRLQKSAEMISISESLTSILDMMRTQISKGKRENRRKR